MRGKKPKERDRYLLRLGDGTLVEVSREVYMEWYRFLRKERYQREKNRKQGVYSLDALEEKGNDAGIPMDVFKGLEETVMQKISRDHVREALRELSDSDAGLIELLYFRDATVTDAAEIYGCSRKTIQNRRKRILGELYQIMRKQGIQEGYF